MSQVSIINIGDEITSGKIANTGGQNLVSQLIASGHKVPAIHCVGDQLEELQSIFDLELKRCDILILTGGLGPTEDDRTRFFLSEITQLTLIENADVLKDIQQFFKKRNKEFLNLNSVQALLPQGAKAIPNPIGTACGIDLFWKETRIFCIPGVPSEMDFLFRNHILPAISSTQFFSERKLLSFGLGESLQTELLNNLVLPSNLQLASLPELSGLLLRLTGTHKDSKFLENQLDTTFQEILTRLQNESACIVNQDGSSIPKTLVDILNNQKQTISFAESCTGGMIASLITDIPGSSSVFKGSLVTYSNEKKKEWLEVSDNTLEKYGAVSAEVVLQMAKGCRQKTGCDWAGAISGIAGPDGGSPQKPVGLVWMAICSAKRNIACVFQFSGNRNQIRTKSAYALLDLIRREILNINLGAKIVKEEN